MYILLFRKLPTDASTAYADEPVVKEKADYSLIRWQIDAHAYWRSSGDRLLGKEDMANLPMKQMQKVYTAFSRETVYNYEENGFTLEQLYELRAYNSYAPKLFPLFAARRYAYVFAGILALMLAIYYYAQMKSNVLKKKIEKSVALGGAR